MDNQVLDEVSATIANPVIAGKLNVLADVSNRMESPRVTAISLKAYTSNAFAPIDVRGCVKGHLIQAVILGR